MLSNFGDCVQYKEIVKSSLEELITGSKEVQEEAEKILDTENLFEAQQLLLHHQVECLFTLGHLCKVD
jgi:nesprin-1